MNGLFHGLDFHKLQSEAGVFTYSGFIYALIVLMVWAFGLGALFGWMYSLLGRTSVGAAIPEEKDPVCGMTVHAATAAGRYDYRGRTYFFCSDRCLATFKADPAKHAREEEHPGHPVAHA